MTSPRNPNIPDTVQEASVILDEAYEEKVREQAQAHLESSITTLSDLAKGEDADGETVETTPATRRGAANDLISHGYAREAGGRPDALGGGGGRGGIHIQIVSYGDLPDVRIEHEAVPPPIDVEYREDEDDERRAGEEVHVPRAEERPARAVRDAPRVGEGLRDADRGDDPREPRAVSRAYTP